VCGAWRSLLFFFRSNGLSSNKKWRWPAVGVPEQAVALAAVPGPPVPWAAAACIRRLPGWPQLASAWHPGHHRRRKPDLGLGLQTEGVLAQHGAKKAAEWGRRRLTGHSVVFRRTPASNQAPAVGEGEAAALRRYASRKMRRRGVLRHGKEKKKRNGMVCNGWQWWVISTQLHEFIQKLLLRSTP
jgi:hypothetical protein